MREKEVRTMREEKDKREKGWNDNINVSGIITGYIARVLFN